MTQMGNAWIFHIYSYEFKFMDINRLYQSLANYSFETKVLNREERFNPSQLIFAKFTLATITFGFHTSDLGLC